MSHEVGPKDGSVPPSSADEPQTPARRRKWLLLIVAVLIAAAIGVSVATRQGHGGKEAQAGGGPKAAAPVVVATAHQGDIDIFLDALGTVTPVYNIKLTSRVQGEITKIPFKEGQLVRKGDLLLEIDSRPYTAALAQAQGHLARDQAVLRQAQIDLTRYKSAFEQKVIPQQQYDDQVQIVRQDEGTVKEDQGAADAAKLNVEYCHITSPIDGRVGLRQVDPGNIVDASGTKVLAVITQLKPIDVIFSIAEDNLGAIQEQLLANAQLQVEVFDRNQTKKLTEGLLITTDNVVDTTTGTVKLKAEFANEHAELFPNQFVNVRLRVKTDKDQTLVPTLAIQRNALGPFVYLVQADQTVKIQAVKVGAADGKDSAVTGIKSGDVVVTGGFDKIQDGAKIAVQEAATTAAAESAP